MSSSYAQHSLVDKDMILPPHKDNGVFSAWNYASKGGRRRKSRLAKTYRRGKVGRGRRTRSHRVRRT